MFVWRDQYKISNTLRKFLREQVRDCEDFAGIIRHSARMLPISNAQVGLWYSRGTVSVHTDYSRKEEKRTAGLVLINDRNHDFFCDEYDLELPPGCIFYMDGSQEHGTCVSSDVSAERPSFRTPDPHGLLVFVAIDVPMDQVPTPHDFLVEVHTMLEGLIDYGQEIDA